MGMFQKKAISGLLSEDIKIKPFSNWDCGYSIDDKFISDLVEFIRKYKIRDEKDLIENMSLFCFRYLDSSNGGEVRRKFFQEYIQNVNALNADEESIDSLDSIKLSELKNKGVSMCSEYAALTQQCLSLLGVDSSFVIGRLNIKTDEKEIEEYHAYNIVNVDEKDFIIDTIISNKKYNEDGKIKMMKSNICKLEGGYEDLLEGVSMNRYDIQMDNGKKCKKNNREMVYTALLETIEDLNDDLEEEYEFVD